ncbi:MAG: alkaline phosphatase [Rhodothermales bacterium]|nr:alkaline phosphatase [Rhodothermales bacterium]
MLRQPLLLVFLVTILSGCSGMVQNPQDSQPVKAKNVILFISDGTGPASFTLARDYLRATGNRRNLYLDDILVGTMETSSASHLITGSGAAATAMASGYKTNNLVIGQDPDGNPLRSILEKAEAAGMHTGVIVTREITDATPAAFTAHVAHRYDNELDVAVQQLSSGADILVGGGLEMFQLESQGGKRTDGRDLVEEARAGGYEVVTSRQEWDQVQNLPVLALLARDKLAYEIDRNPLDAPSLAELVDKSIQMLDQAGTGFFLLVEGSRIDLAGHDNDAPAHLHDLIAYDEAVNVGLNFARKNGETLVISTSDHETGGLSIGRSYTWYPDKMQSMTASHDSTVTMLQNGASPTDVLKQYYGIEDVSPAELARLDTLTLRNDYDRALGEVIGDRLFIDWATTGHTAVDVNVYAFGPGSSAFRNHFDITHIGLVLPDLMGLQTD